MDSVFLGHFELAATHLNDPSKAFTIIEGIRGRSIADTLRSRPVNRGPEPASLTTAEKEISRLQLRILKAGAVERKKLMTDLLNLEQRAGQIEAEEDPPRLRQQTQPIPITRLQKALAEDEAILEYVLTDPVSYCLAISRDHVAVFKLASRAQIGKQVDQVVATVRKNGAFGSAGSRALCNAVSAGGNRRVCEGQIDCHSRWSALLASIRSDRTIGRPASAVVSCRHVCSIRNCIHASV